MNSSTPLGPGPEFDVIRAMLAAYGPAARAIGDDAAALDLPAGEVPLVSTDVSVENVHFRRAWMSPREIGFRATTAALSDLAAMAARPRGVVVALTLPESWRAAAPEIASGIGEAARAAATVVIGGDTSAGRELSLAVTVIGSCARPLTRSGARPGDAVWVTGALGGPALALEAWGGESEPEPAHRARFVSPVARFAAAEWLRDRGATACIDISDGLVADAAHIAAASGVRVRIELARVPCVAGAPAHLAAASGEEYELCVTGPPDWDAAACERDTGTRLTRIGTVDALAADELPGVAAFDESGPVTPPRGYSHFQP
ncbi:MAG: thiamine-phosphate kinase [Gemmatimonadetes bacterium]|nr:thiamine-phosphate kinase [Gemmatimonadota bacterium]